MLALAGGPLVLERQRADAAGLEARADAARAGIAALEAGRSLAGGAEARALEVKGAAVSLALALDDLAAALPDTAHATEITFADGRLTVTGLGADVPAAVTALEASGRFTQTRVLSQSRDDAAPSPLTVFTLETRPASVTGLLQ